MIRKVIDKMSGHKYTEDHHWCKDEEYGEKQGSHIRSKYEPTLQEKLLKRISANSIVKHMYKKKHHVTYEGVELEHFIHQIPNNKNIPSTLQL